jgi:phospholipid transport system substrate-binding protein
MNRSGTRSLASLSLLVLSLVFSLGDISFAGESGASLGPLERVKSSVSRVLAIVQTWPMGSDERRSRIVRVTRELFDMNEMARRALGQHWQGLSRIEQEAFVRLFTDVLDRAFVAGMDGYTNEKVAFLGEEIDGAWAHVRSRVITNRGTGMSVDYRLSERGARWAVYDVVWDNVSVVANYRSQFNSVIRTSSFDQLLERMRTGRPRSAEPIAHAPLVPERLAAGLFFAVLTRHASPK